MTDRFVQLLTRRSARILIVAVVAAVAGGVIGAPVERLLVPARVDFNDPSAESGRVEGVLSKTLKTGPAGGVIAVVHTNGNVLTDKASRRQVGSVRADLRADPAIAAVTSAPTRTNRGSLSRNGRGAYLVATLRDIPAPDIQRAVHRLQAKFRGTPGVTLGGTEVAYTEAGDQSKHDLVSSELIALPLLLILALLVFGGVVATLLPLLIGGLSIVFTLAGMRLINEVVPLSNFALNLVTALALALAIDYSLFIVTRFREELGAGHSVEESLVRTMTTAGRTVAISAVTIGAALAALTVFPQRFLYSMGIAGALVAFSAAAVSLTVLPAMLALLGRRVDALPLRRKRASSRQHVDTQAGLWYRLGKFVLRRPAPVALLTAAALVIIALPVLRTHFIPFSSATLPTTASARQVDDSLRTEFRSSGSPVTVIAAAKPQARRSVRRLAASISRLPAAAKVKRPQLIAGDRWVITALARGTNDTPQARELVNAIRGLRGTPPIQVGGVTATSIDKLDSLRSHLPIALALIAATTFLLVFVLTGSVVLPIKALLINLLTIGGAFGVLVLLFQDGHLHGVLGFSTQHGLEATQPVLLFALAFGLSTDYGIFLLARITEAHERGMPTSEAAAFGLQHTGRIITAAALLFCVAIGALATSPLVIIKLFGVGTVVAVVLDATLARALLVPALIGLLGRWNWWAPSPLRRLHRKLHASGRSLPVASEDRAAGFDSVRPPHPTEAKSMERIALLTAECCQVTPAIAEFIRRNHDRLALVVTSDVSRGKRFGIARQVIQNYRRSGLRFVSYLSYSFVLYFAYARFDKARAWITRTPRKCETVAELCARSGIPYTETADINSPETEAQLAAAQLDCIVIYWFDQIIKDNIIAVPSRGVINVHAAFLPQCRGLFPVFYSATKNSGNYGITAHQIDNTEIDAGPVLAQIRVDAPQDRTIIFRDAVVNLAGVDMICRILDDFSAYHAEPSHSDGGSYFSYPSRGEVATAHRTGTRLASLTDFLAVCRAELPAAGDERSAHRAPGGPGAAHSDAAPSPAPVGN